MRSFYLTVRTALRALRRHLLRSALTCAGIVIGIAAVVTLMEIGQGTAEAVRQTIATLGANFVQVEAGSSSSSGVHWGAGTCLTLTPQDCEAILRECGAVRWARKPIRSPASLHSRYNPEDFASSSGTPQHWAFCVNLAGFWLSSEWLRRPATTAHFALEVGSAYDKSGCA